MRVQIYLRAGLIEKIILLNSFKLLISLMCDYVGAITNFKNRIDRDVAVVAMKSFFS